MVPVIAPSGQVIAVLDVDSDDAAAFSGQDVALLESICEDLGQRYGTVALATIPGMG